MTVTREIIRDVHLLNTAVHKAADAYHHTRPVAISRSNIVAGNALHLFDIFYDLKDLLTIGAITQSPVLLTGGTDMGKTTLAKFAMAGLFGNEGEGWHRLDIDTDFGKDTYADKDMSVITEGKKLSDGFYTAQSWLALPGLILDELNRTHSAIGNKLLHILDRDITLPDGKRVKVGYPYEENKTFQFQITAINEGADYTGTFDMDKALRRRTIIEIPFDVFPPTPVDRMFIQRQNPKDTLNADHESNLVRVLRIYTAANKEMKMNAQAQMFLSYMESFDYCKNSLNGEKGSVHAKGGSIHHICTQPRAQNNSALGEGSCEFLRAFTNDLCPYVRGVTPGISKNLVHVAQGFALLRATKFVDAVSGYTQGKSEKALSYKIDSADQWESSLQKYVGAPIRGEELARAAAHKYIDTLVIERQDIESAITFVGYSKINIAENYVQKYYQGNKYEAIRRFTQEAQLKFEQGITYLGIDKVQRIATGTATNEEINESRKYCNAENPWLWRALSPFLDVQPQEKIPTINLYD